jgi:hypothetical protein
MSGAPDVMGEIVWCRLRKVAETRDGSRWGIGLASNRVMWVDPDEVDAAGGYDMGQLVVHVRMTRCGAVQWGWGDAILPDWTDGVRALCLSRCRRTTGETPCAYRPAAARREILPCRDCLVGRPVGAAA